MAKKNVTTAVAAALTAAPIVTPEVPPTSSVPDIDAELEALLGNASPTTPVIVSENAMLEEIETALITKDLKAESYSVQEPETEGETPVVASVSSELKTRTPRVSTAGKTPFEIVESWGEEATAKAAMFVKGDTGSPEEVDAMKATLGKLAKKVGEKAVNMLNARRSGKGLQVYTRIGLDLLLAKGEVTSKELVDAMTATKYKIGTARSQTNQLMQLFPALRIADRVAKGSLKLNEDSLIVAELRAATAS